MKSPRLGPNVKMLKCLVDHTCFIACPRGDGLGKAREGAKLAGPGAQGAIKHGMTRRPWGEGCQGACTCAAPYWKNREPARCDAQEGETTRLGQRDPHLDTHAIALVGLVAQHVNLAIKKKQKKKS